MADELFIINGLNDKDYSKAVEYARMKKYKMFGLRYRNRLRYYDLMTDIVSGLINMKIIGMNI